MFTGIVENIGTVKEVISSGSQRIFWIESPLSMEFKPDQSVSHSGVCLTIEEVIDNRHRVTAVEETLEKSNLGDWEKGSLVNLERSLRIGDRLDGHMVQGHIDGTAICIKKKGKQGNLEYEFEYSKKFSELVIEKGSVCINGISLTAFNVKKKSFKTAIIPFTYEHTNMSELLEGDKVNIEFDIIGKYLKKHFKDLWF